MHSWTESTGTITMAILSLPIELLQLIIQKVDKADLPALTLVSRDLRVNVLPFLYKSVTLKGFRCDRPPIYPLVRALLKNPTFGPWIRYATIWTLNLNPQRRAYWASGDSEKSNDGDLRLMKRYIRGSGLPSTHTWLSAVDKGCVDACAAIALSKMTRLRMLRLQIRQDGRFLDFLLRGALSLQPGIPPISHFGGLKKVVLGFTPLKNASSFPVENLEISHILPLFFLPVIKCIGVSGVDIKMPFKWPGAKKPDCLSLDTLILREASIKPAVLGHLLKATPNLRQFHFNHVANIDGRVDTSPETLVYDLGDLRDALMNVRTSLVRLTLGINCLLFGTASVDPMFSYLCFLTNILGPLDVFEKLVYLEIPPVFLFGFLKHASPTDKLLLRLPPSLETLSLRKDMGTWGDYTWDAMDCLEHLGPFLEDKMNAPGLKSIAVDIDEGTGYWTPIQEKAIKERGRSIKKACDSDGIKCTFKHRSLKFF